MKMPKTRACTIPKIPVPPQPTLLPKANSNAARDINGHQTTSLMTKGAQGFVMLRILVRKIESLKIKCNACRFLLIQEFK
jgi:hypothetical protein